MGHYPIWKDTIMENLIHDGNQPGICEKTDLPKIGSIWKWGRHLTIAHHNVNNALLNLSSNWVSIEIYNMTL